MIPKIIHYCWFGGAKKTALIEHCIDSWRKYLPNYKIIEWNESCHEIMNNKFLRSALSSRKFAFASDYVRAYALHQYGGIYLDTDVEVKNNFDEFLVHSSFSGFEKGGLPFTAVWGSEPKHLWSECVLKYYDGKVYDDSEPPNTITVSKILQDYFEIDPLKDELQIGSHGVVIYPSSTFCLDLPVNYACHHFAGSWMPEENRTYKNFIHNEYYLKQYLNSVMSGNPSNLEKFSDHLVSHGVFTSKLFILILKDYLIKACLHLKKKFI